MNRTKFLLRASAIYGLIGAFIGSHMASGDYSFKAIHAHILVVGWLSLFAFAIYYRSFKIPKNSKLAFVHVWSSFLGSIGLTVGFWLYYLKPIQGIETFNLLLFIVGGTLILIAYGVFTLMTFVYGNVIKEHE